jgi:hypothetical protein
MQSRPSVGVGAAEALSGAYWDRRPRANSPRPTSSSSRESRHQAQTSHLSKQVFTHDATRHRPDHPGINWTGPHVTPSANLWAVLVALRHEPGLRATGGWVDTARRLDRHCNGAARASAPYREAQTRIDAVASGFERAADVLEANEGTLRSQGRS